jgi:hypothetical protein
MGVAVGSKYNAPIAFLIVNLLLIFIYARNTNKQIASIKYGLIFALIAMLVASPWYLKNFFFTGNPFYPLFNSFFQLLYQHSVENLLQCQEFGKKGGIGLFQMRELLYGEKLWEMLLIPIRIFFQGSDYGYQYFQGVLNPILIIFSPFILINKKYSRDKYIFVFFSIIFISLALFLTQQEVRYLLPTFPFLTILAVMGIKDITEWLNKVNQSSSMKRSKVVTLFFKYTIFISIIVLLSFNFFYLKNRINTIKPFPYIWGKETKNQFLKRHLSYFPTVNYINCNLPNDAIVFTILLGKQGYYFDTLYKNESSFGMDILSCMVQKSDSEREFRRYIKILGATHILWKSDLVQKYLADNFDEKAIKRFYSLIKQNWLLLYQDGQYSVFDLHA